MKRSHQVSAPLLAAAALTLLNGCRQPQPKRCVDEQNHVVDDKFCQNLPNQQPGQPLNQQSHGPSMIFMPYHYYYGGSGGFGLGSTVYGGGYTPSPGVSYTTRGGFGSSFSDGGSHSSSGHSSGGGE